MTSKDYSVVAVLDLLGFSQIMDEQSLDEIEKRYTKSLMSAVTLAGLSSIGAFVFDKDGRLDAGEDLWTISFGVFSDTVVIYPQRPAGPPLRTTCEAVALLVDAALQSDWLFRGGIDFGTFRALSDHNVYLGKALIGAHRLEGTQNWAGAVVSDEAQRQYPQEVKDMLGDGLLVKYPAPMKRRFRVARQERVVVNWCYFDMRWRVDGRERLSGLLDSAPTAARSKVQATLQFHDEMQSRGSASLSQIGKGRVFGDPTGGMP